MVNIFILKLKQNKYYIGTTTKPNFDFTKHFNYNEIEWTTKYQPIELIEFIKNCDDDDADEYTCKYMEKYGLNNVRGGSFNDMKINENDQEFLENRFNEITDKCYICGSHSHDADECKKEDCFENGKIYCCKICNQEFKLLNDLLMHGRKCKTDKCEKCSKCGRYNHNASKCPSKIKNYQSKNENFFND
jgi:predicted GIY-YIG superfamily endonuclease